MQAALGLMVEREGEREGGYVHQSIVRWVGGVKMMGWSRRLQRLRKGGMAS